MELLYGLFFLVVLKRSISFQQILLKTELVVRLHSCGEEFCPETLGQSEVGNGRNNSSRWAFSHFLCQNKTRNTEFVFISVMRAGEQ